MPEFDACPGCKQPLDEPGCCFNCHYFDLVSGRAHYCGQPGCSCYQLRREMPVSLLRTFVPKGDEGDPRFMYGIEYPGVLAGGVPGRIIQAPLTKPYALQMVTQGPTCVVIRRPVDMSADWEVDPDA